LTACICSDKILFLQYNCKKPCTTNRTLGINENKMTFEEING